MSCAFLLADAFDPDLFDDPPLPMSAKLTDNSLAPTGLFIQADAHCGFRDHLMREEGISGMNSAQSGIADQSLVTRRAKDPGTAGHIQAKIHDAPGALDRAVLGSKYL